MAASLADWTPLPQARSRWLLLSAGLLSLGLTGVSILAFPALPLQNDSVSYYDFARHFRGLDSQASLFYPPGYPLFLAALSREWTASFGRDLLIAQHLFRLFPLILFSILAMVQPRSLLPGAAALIFAVAPENYIFAHFMMSESLALGLASLAGISFLMLWIRPGRGRAAAAGVVAGMLTLVKPAGAACLIAAAFVPGRARKVLSFSPGIFLTAVVSWTAVVASCVIYNAAAFQAASLTNSAGRHLFNRVVAEDGCFRPGDSELAHLENLRGARPGEAPTYWWNYLPILVRGGLSESQADRLLLGIGLRGIISNPACYLAGTARGAVSLLFWRTEPPRGASSYRVLEHELGILRTEGDAAAFWQRRIPDKESLWRILVDLDPVFMKRREGAWLERWAGVWGKGVSAAGIFPALFVGAGVAWAVASGNAPALLMCALLVPGVLAHSAMEMSVPRYGLPFQPFTFYLLCAGASGVGLLLRLHGVKGRLRRQRPLRKRKRVRS